MAKEIQHPHLQVGLYSAVGMGLCVGYTYFSGPPRPSPPLPQTGVSHVSARHPRLDSMDLPRVTDAEGGGVHRALGGRRHPLRVPCLSTEDRQEEQEREERLDVAGYNRRLPHASC